MHVTINTEVIGTLADNMTNQQIDEQFFNEAEKDISKQIEMDMKATLKKLQHELKTDITNIGRVTFRTYPKEWHEIKPEWDEIFSNAEVKVNVDTTITHQGLINKKLEPKQKKPYNNPYNFWK